MGDLARRTGKTVRAIHLYEEMGLLSAPVRSKGGFRMYSGDGVKRIEWIQKLQDMGFSLPEVKTFLRVWQESATAPAAMATVREIFAEKLRETRETIARLSRLADELGDSLKYLERCRFCSSTHAQSECCACGSQDSDQAVPLLVDGIANRNTP
ncbi:MAG: MerR family transcriptional regulator [Deltaproteobacteria bacterium]|nr:MerR family transcriptional regulator [Deltaproteobacteria bacterium]